MGTFFLGVVLGFACGLVVAIGMPTPVDRIERAIEICSHVGGLKELRDYGQIAVCNNKTEVRFR